MPEWEQDRDSMNRLGNRKSALSTLFALGLAAIILPAGSPASEFGIEPEYVIGGDMIVSYDEPGTLNDALHPSVAVAPRGSPWEGTIHVVWDEYDEYSGFREIHYSSSQDEGATWSHDRDDFPVSNVQKGRANIGDAIHPSVAVDPNGNVHVIWMERMQSYGTWEVMYSHSSDNGLTWSGSSADIRISQLVGNNNDAMTMSPPDLVIGTPMHKAFPVFHAVWSEMSEKQDEEVVHYSRSTNGGLSWSGQEMDYLLSQPGVFARDPAVAYSGAEANYLHVAWSQEGPYGFDEIFYRCSDYYGQGGSWREIRPISYVRDDGMVASDVAFAGGAYDDVHAVWKQHFQDKAQDSVLTYSSSPDNGQYWLGAEGDFPICDQDGFEPFDPCISVGDRRVQVMWSEVDEGSPRGTREVHTSWTYEPLNPGKWTGLERDIVLSNGDEWGPAHAGNVSMNMGEMRSSGLWEPVFVWDELNDEPTKDRAERNNEIHTEPLAEWSLSTAAYGSGSVYRNPDQASYDDGTWVTLTAVADAGWHFDHWGGDLAGSSNPDSILMDGDKSVTAYFVQDQYALTVNAYGSGSVSRSPDQPTYTYGQTVTLTATPAFGWRFDHWTGAISGSTNPQTIAMYGSYTANAHFYQNIHNIPLASGWNMVSLPYLQADTSVATVLSSISGSYEVAKCYDALDAADPWKTYRPGGTANDLANVNHRMGIWIKATAPCTLAVYGDIPASTNIPLHTGWNLVGYPSQTARLASATLPAVADIVGVYTASSPYITDYANKALVTMSQGNGYWVHVTADTVWTVTW